MPNIEIDSKKGLVQKSGSGGHLKSIGETPSLVLTKGGGRDGTCTLSGTDTVGTLTFGATWASTDKVDVVFARPFGSAPQVLLASGASVNGSGESLVEIDTLAVTESGFTLTCSGTCVGKLSYLVVETSAS